MAAKKTPPAKKPTPTLKEKKTTRATARGFESVEAMASARKAGWNTQAQVEAALTSQGWGAGQPVGTPIMIGGMRWISGGTYGAAKFTGERSDAAKRNPGSAWAGNTLDQTQAANAAPGGSTSSGLAAEGGKAAPWMNADLSGGGVVTLKGEGDDIKDTDATKPKTPKKKRPAAKMTSKAKSKKSPGGKKVTPKERKRIQAVKAKTRKG